MNVPGVPDPGAVAARRLLLDVLEQLGESRERVVLVGAQAVLLHIGASTLPVVLATFDGDLSVDPRTPLQTDLAKVLDSVGLEMLAVGGIKQPGIWGPKKPVDGKRLSIDLLVPEAFAPKRGQRGVDLVGQAPDAARYVRGLEASLVDRGSQVVTSLDETDKRRIATPVAGPGALLIAKLHKLSDRVRNARRPDRVTRKIATRDLG